MLDQGQTVITRPKTPTVSLTNHSPERFVPRTYTKAEATLLESMMIRLIPTDPAHSVNVNGCNLPINPSASAKKAIGEASRETRQRVKTGKPISQIIYDAMSLNHKYTVAQICSITGLNRPRVNASLRHLREYGRVKSAGYIASAGLYVKVSK